MRRFRVWRMHATAMPKYLLNVFYCVRSFFCVLTTFFDRKFCRDCAKCNPYSLDTQNIDN